jgi:hypothetical protein
MRVLIFLVAAVAFFTACYMLAENCEPGDKGIKIGSVMLISGCE